MKGEVKLLIALVLILVLMDFLVFYPKIKEFNFSSNFSNINETQINVSDNSNIIIENLSLEEIKEIAIPELTPQQILDAVAKKIEPNPNPTSPDPPDQICDALHLDLCKTSTECTNAGYYWYYDVCNKNQQPDPFMFTLASWNFDYFNKINETDESSIEFYADIIDKYNIVFIQKIRNSNEDDFDELCDFMDDYDCEISSSTDGGDNKEMIGIIYKDSIDIDDFNDYNLDEDNGWSLPPIEISFDVEGEEFIVWSIRLDPEKVEEELEELEAEVSNNKIEIIIGKLYTDCDYYDADRNTEFDSWNWLFDDGEDTTTNDEDCTYNNILMNNESFQIRKDEGIFTSDIDESISDDYLIWVELEV